MDSQKTDLGFKNEKMWRDKESSVRLCRSLAKNEVPWNSSMTISIRVRKKNSSKRTGGVFSSTSIPVSLLMTFRTRCGFTSSMASIAKRSSMLSKVAYRVSNGGECIDTQSDIATSMLHKQCFGNRGWYLCCFWCETWKKEQPIGRSTSTACNP